MQRITYHWTEMRTAELPDECPTGTLDDIHSWLDANKKELKDYETDNNTDGYELVDAENVPNEWCAECGESVAAGSGRYVNRIPECNDYEEKVEMGRKHPTGDYICSECDLVASD